MVTTGACLIILSLRQPSLPSKEVACCLGPFLPIVEDFSQKSTTRQFILRREWRCTRESHAFSKCSRTWAFQSSLHLAQKGGSFCGYEGARLDSHHGPLLKYCLSKHKTDFIGSLEIEHLYSGGACCFIPGSLTSHHVGHCRDEDEVTWARDRADFHRNILELVRFFVKIFPGTFQFWSIWHFLSEKCQV